MQLVTLEATLSEAEEENRPESYLAHLRGEIVTTKAEMAEAKKIPLKTATP